MGQTEYIIYTELNVSYDQLLTFLMLIQEFFSVQNPMRCLCLCSGKDKPVPLNMLNQSQPSLQWSDQGLTLLC